MRKYLKPALEIEAFDVEDVITASGTVTSGIVDGTTVTPPGGSNGAANPIIDGIELN